MANLNESDDYSIRLMTQQDVEVVAAIEVLSYPFPWPRSIFVDSLNAGFCGQVITHSSEICGYIFTQNAANECHILNLCVDPKYRGLGLAMRLLTTALESAKLREDRRVYLEVRESNVSALNLYEKFGFFVVGRRRDYYPTEGGKEDALLLTKELP